MLFLILGEKDALLHPTDRLIEHFEYSKQRFETITK